MKCSICGKDKNKNYITTIVHDPPIDICGECRLIIRHLETIKEYEYEKTSKVA